MEKKGSSSISSCSASSSSSMEKKTTTCSPKGSSSSSFSGNPLPATQPYDEILQRFQNLWSNNADGVPMLSSTPEIETVGCLSYNDLGKQQINGVQEQRFQYLGSSSNNPSIAEDKFKRYIDFKKNNRPTTTHAQLMAYLALINGGTLLNSFSDHAGNYLSSMNYGLDQFPVNLVSRFNGLAVNHQLSNGYTLEDSTCLPDSIDDPDLDVRNLRCKLVESKGWPVEKVLKICSDDPSLLDEIKPDDIVMVAELKLGSLYLQRILKDQNPLYFDKIFNATLEDMFRLMTNSEGTYVIRKLHSLCDSSHMNKIVWKIRSERDLLKNAARNEFGADTLMKLIRVLKNTNPFFHKCVLDSCLKYLDPRQNQILHNRIATYCIDLATDESGYVSLIALIENTSNPYKEELLFKISDKAVYLSQDPKGNYVIQAILSLRIPEIDLMICRNLVGSYLCLSMHKCASNVVEKCIMSSGMEYPILELICSHKLHLLSQDPMGNYVVQRALNTTQQLKRLNLYDNLVGEIQPYLKELRYHPIGRNVFRLINKRKVIINKFV